MKKKVLLIVLGVILSLIAAAVLALFLSLRPVKGSEEILKVKTFVVNEGDSKIEVVSNLKDAGIIRSKLGALVYVFFSPNLNLKAGTYELDLDDSTPEIIKQIHEGVGADTVVITFIEGKRFTEYAKTVSEHFAITEEEFLTKTADKEYLQSLIDKYWFLDESILDERIYYPLEGYLYPNTYEFYKDASIEDIVEKMLDTLGHVLEGYKEEIEASSYSVHELLTIASISEIEAIKEKDRSGVSQVIYKRLEVGMTLGMDVTAYYGAGLDLKEDITAANGLYDDNPYNTRNPQFKGLPVGAICSPSKMSIDAALNPSDTQYLYFLADKDGNVHFAHNDAEFQVLKQKYL